MVLWNWTSRQHRKRDEQVLKIPRRNRPKINCYRKLAESVVSARVASMQVLAARLKVAELQRRGTTLIRIIYIMEPKHVLGRKAGIVTE